MGKRGQPRGQAVPAEKTKDYNARALAAGGPAGCILYADGQTVRLSSGEALIGREADCDLLLQDASVSRHHVRLQVSPDGIVVEDLGSTNGTTYLDKRIDRVTLRPGSRICVGNCWVDLLPPTDAESVPVSERSAYGDLRGDSLPMRRLYSLMEMLEGSDAPVLIEGETGTGKELVARALHANSPRSHGPLVIIDCGNVPADLVESELFGHCKGAFTGAVADRTGAFEAADGGTVFLDELDELPVDLQPKLLRVLETGQVKRVGEARHESVDVRLIAATKRDLAAEVDQGRFRSDLYYRIAVVHLELPPLRERREDIPLLIAHLAGQISQGQKERLPPEAEELMMHHDWPGNVRELRNAVHRTLTLGLVHIGLARGASAKAAGGLSTLSFREARDDAMARFETAYLADLMQRFEGNVSAAARHAGIDRGYLRRLLKKNGLYE